MSQIVGLGTAQPAHVLTGETFTSGSGADQQGSMPNNGGVTLTPSGTGTVQIPQGYHDGTGKVAQVNVPAANVLAGTTIAGVAGSMPNEGAVTLTPSGTGTVAIPAGYHNGNGVVAQVNVPAADVLAGTTIAGVAGTMPNQGSPTITPGAAQNLPAGYYGGIAINAATQTASGTATSSTSYGSFRDPSNNSISEYYITVSGLSFTPKFVQIMCATNGLDFVEYDSYDVYENGTYPATIYVSQGQKYLSSTQGSASITATGFQLPVTVANTSYKWRAWG